MGKTITIRLDDSIYKKIKSAAEAENRTISNFIQNATLVYVERSSFITDEEMEDILKNRGLIRNLQESLKDIEKGNYTIIG